MSDKQRILIVDDERQITRVLSRGLAAKGYEIHVAADGEAALQTFSDWHPDLVITDLSMPNMNGLELCRRLRAFSEVPIIVLSVKGEERSKVDALDAGADDYVTKPFGIQELMARIRAALRRGHGSGGEQAALGVHTEHLEIDFDSRKVVCGGKPVRLTPKEFDLLRILVANANRAVPHRKLL